MTRSTSSRHFLIFGVLIIFVAETLLLLDLNGLREAQIMFDGLREAQSTFDRRVFADSVKHKRNSASASNSLPTIAYAFIGYKGDMYSIPVALAAVFDASNVYCVQLDASVSQSDVDELRDLIIHEVLDWNRGNHAADPSLLRLQAEVRILLLL